MLLKLVRIGCVGAWIWENGAYADQWRSSVTVPNGRLLREIILGEKLIMMTFDFRTCLPILIALTTWVFFPHAEAASDDLGQSSRVGQLRIPLVSYERIPIATVLAHPDRYQMREIRLTGMVTMIQTETVANRLICGRAHERTVLMVEDDSGQIEIVDQGACGRNVGSLKAPMLKVGQQIDLLVLIVIPARSSSVGSSLEATIRYLDLSRN